VKIVGQLVCGPGEAKRYLKSTLDEFQRLCDDVIVATCNAHREDIKLIEKYDFRHYEDNREWGYHQPSIKTDLVRRIQSLKADWILALDADETVPTVTRQVLGEIGLQREAAQFYVVNLWNDEQHYMRSMAFWNVRFYKADPSKGVQFLRKPVHCGNAPPYFYTVPARQSYVPHILLHKGLMLPGDRERKAQRYNVYDPSAEHKGREYYDALVADGTGTEYHEEEVIKKVTQFCGNL
jgi:hypothetical protein